MIHKNRFSIKSSKILYPLSKPPPKFGEILVIWGGLDKGFYDIFLPKINAMSIWIYIKC